jgi:hypothetical protein
MAIVASESTNDFTGTARIESVQRGDDCTVLILRSHDGRKLDVEVRASVDQNATIGKGSPPIAVRLTKSARGHECSVWRPSPHGLICEGVEIGYALALTEAGVHSVYQFD